MVRLYAFIIKNNVESKMTPYGQWCNKKYSGHPKIKQRLSQKLLKNYNDFSRKYG
jgi:hypothetical protein